MRIITVNLPESYIHAIEHLIGENAMYPSRSELIRVAVREFLIKELSTAQNFSQFQPQTYKMMPQDHKVHIPQDLSGNLIKDLDDPLEQD